MLNWREKSDEQIAKFCVSQQGHFETVRKPWEPLYDAAIKLFLPRRYDLSLKRRPGEQYGVGIFDQWPANAVSKFAVGLTGNMVARDETDPWWLQFVSEKQELMENDDVKKFMQDSAEQSRFGFNQSTFYTELPQLIKDAGVCYGAMTAEVDKVDGRVVFLTRHPKNHWVGLDRFGRVRADHFKVKMSAYDMVKEFGDKVPEDIKKQAQGGENQNPFTEHEILHCIYRNENRFENSLNHLEKPYIMFYVLAGATDGTSPRLLAKEGSDWGVINLRIGATLGDAYPLSMALDAMTSGCYSNLLSKYKLLAGHLSVQGPRRISRSLRAQVIENRLNPNSNTYVDNPEEIIEYLTQKINWPFAEAESQDLHQSIDWVFYVQFFEMLTGTEDRPTMTAYQVGQMISEKVTMMGPTIDSIQDNVLEPASSVIWSHETRAGRMPDPPDILLEETQGKVINQYMGRLAQLRRTLRRNKGTLEVLQVLEVFANLFPNSLTKIKEFDFLEKALIAKGMDQDMFRSDEEMAEIEAMMQQREQMEQQLQIAERMGKAVPGLSKKIEPGSPAGMLTGTS